MSLQERLLHLVDEDTEAFNRIMAAFGMPKNTPEEKAARSEAIQKATLFAAEVPLETMKASFEQSKLFLLVREYLLALWRMIYIVVIRHRFGKTIRDAQSYFFSKCHNNSYLYSTDHFLFSLQLSLDKFCNLSLYAVCLGY